MWLFPALLASLSVALFAAINQRYQLRGDVLIIWRGLIPAFVLCPLLLFVPVPADPAFYLYVGLNAVLVRFYDTWFFETTKRYGAGLPLKLNPLMVIFIFTGWLIVDSEQRAALM